MEKKTIGLIATVTTTILCGLPGLAGLCFGSMSLLGSFMPENDVPNEDVALVLGFSIMIVGLSLVSIVIPIGIGIWTWWIRKPQLNLDKIRVPEEDF
jgi:hypothetical protein